MPPPALLARRADPISRYQAEEDVVPDQLPGILTLAQAAGAEGEGLARTILLDRELLATPERVRSVAGLLPVLSDDDSAKVEEAIVGYYRLEPEILLRLVEHGDPGVVERLLRRQGVALRRLLTSAVSGSSDRRMPRLVHDPKGALGVKKSSETLPDGCRAGMMLTRARMAMGARAPDPVWCGGGTGSTRGMPMQRVRVRVLLPALALVLAAACSSDGTGERQVVAAAPPDGQGPPEQVLLPRLPSMHEQFPQVWDEQECVTLDNGTKACPAPDDGAQGPRDPNGRRNPRALAGFSGRYFATELPQQADRKVAVIPETILATTSGDWSAAGLVQNMTKSPVGAVTVTAVLLDAGGKEIGRASAESPVHGLRSGEPAPFAVDSSVPAADVKEVRWTVESSPPAGPPVRDLVVQLYTPALEYGDRAPLDSGISYVEPARPPYPYVERGDVQNFGPRTVQDPEVVAAWIDTDGRVMNVAVAPLRSDPSSVITALEKDKVGWFSFAIDDPDTAARLQGNELILWGVGR